MNIFIKYLYIFEPKEDRTKEWAIKEASGAVLNAMVSKVFFKDVKFDLKLHGIRRAE